VLHSEPVWGNGTTEYALDALLAASRGEPFTCPVDPDVELPMVFSDDLMRGMLALQDGHEEQLGEPQRGYCIPGLSFTARSLFAEIRKHISGFEVTVELDSNMDKFSRLWPDELSTTEAARDLGYSPQNDLAGIVATVLSAHAKRKESAKMTFEAIDTCGSGRINDYMLVKYMRKHMVRGREKFGYVKKRQEMVEQMVEVAMKVMDVDNDGKVSPADFAEWSRRNTIEGYLEAYIAENAPQLLK